LCLIICLWLYKSLILKSEFFSSSIVRRLVRICWDDVFVNVWMTIYCLIFEVNVIFRSMRCDSWDVETWLWETFLTFNCQLQMLNVTIVSNEHSHKRVDVSRLSNSWDLAISSLLHRSTAFLRIFFLFFFVRFLMTAYSYLLAC
jgi:hypothetical protein